VELFPLVDQAGWFETSLRLHDTFLWFLLVLFCDSMLVILWLLLILSDLLF